MQPIRPLTQKIHSGPLADCFRTSVASVLGLTDPTTVPNFNATTHSRRTVRTWVEAHTNGQRSACLIPAPTFPIYDGPPPYAVIAGFLDGSGGAHAVVLDPNTGRLLHDPAATPTVRCINPVYAVAICDPQTGLERQNVWADWRLARMFPDRIKST